MLTFTNAASLDLQFFSMPVLQSGPVLVHLRLEIMDGVLFGCPCLVDIKPDRAVRRRLWQERQCAPRISVYVLQHRQWTQGSISGIASE